MKYSVLGAIVAVAMSLFLVSNARAEEHIRMWDAWAFIADAWITSKISLDEYMPERFIRRDEAAAMLYRFAKHIGKTYEIGYTCSFSDDIKAHTDLVGSIYSACEIWLFKGYNWMFNPTGNITNAQLIAVVMRSLLGMMDERGSHRASEYFEHAVVEGIIPEGIAANDYDRLDESISRGDVALILHAAYERIQKGPLKYEYNNDTLSSLDLPYISSVSSFDRSTDNAEYTKVEGNRIILKNGMLKATVALKDKDGRPLDIGYMAGGTEWPQDPYRMAVFFGNSDRKNIQRDELIFPVHYNNEAWIVTFDVTENVWMVLWRVFGDNYLQTPGVIFKDKITFALFCSSCIEDLPVSSPLEVWFGGWKFFSLIDKKTFDFEMHIVHETDWNSRWPTY